MLTVFGIFEPESNRLGGNDGATLAALPGERNKAKLGRLAGGAAAPPEADRDRVRSRCGGPTRDTEQSQFRNMSRADSALSAVYYAAQGLDV